MAFKEYCLSNHEISRRLNKNSMVIFNFMKLSRNFNSKNSTNRPQILTDVN